MGRRHRHREPLTPAEQDVVLAHRKLARIVAHRMKRTLPAAVDVADMIATGILGLIKAAQDFDPKRGVLFPSYASIRIRGEILDHFRAMDVVKRGDRARAEPGAYRTVALEDLAAAAGEEVSIAELLPDSRTPSPLEVLAFTDWPHSLLHHLPARERRLLELHFRDGLRLWEIGELWALTESRICQVKAIALARLREILMPGKLTVVHALQRVFRETDGCLTRGEILRTMNRLSLRPAPKMTKHGFGVVALWDTLDQRERLFEVQAAADSHPELFRNHGVSVGWTLRDDQERPGSTGAGVKADDDAGAIAPARKEANVADGEPKTCVHCAKRPVSHGESSSAAAARGMGLCWSCYSDNDVRQARRKVVGYPNGRGGHATSPARPAKGGRGARRLCEHCHETGIGEGANQAQRNYAARMHLCTKCYGQKPVRDVQRKKLKLGMGKSGPCPQRKRRTSPPTAERDPAKLLTGPAPTSRKKPTGLARRRKATTSPPATIGIPGLRADLGRCLRTSFARSAAAELRSLADELEDSAKEAAS